LIVKPSRVVDERLSTHKKEEQNALNSTPVRFEKGEAQQQKNGYLTKNSKITETQQSNTAEIILTPGKKILFWVRNFQFNAC